MRLLRVLHVLLVNTRVQGRHHALRVLAALLILTQTQALSALPVLLASTLALVLRAARLVQLDRWIMTPTRARLACRVIQALSHRQRLLPV